MEPSAGALWHVLAAPVEVSGDVEVSVDPGSRDMMTQLHASTHILNALVFQEFHGALGIDNKGRHNRRVRIGLAADG